MYSYVDGALTVLPTAPTPKSDASQNVLLANAVATLEAIQLFSQPNAMLNLSSTITVTQGRSADTVVGDNTYTSNTSSPASEKGEEINTAMMVGTMGPALRIMNGGIKLPGNLVNVNE